MSYTKGKWEAWVHTSGGITDQYWICVEHHPPLIARVMLRHKDTKELKANAKHIVRCVNSHDALLEACKDARHTFAELLEEGRLVQAGEKDIMPVVWSIIDDMIGAIEKAEQ